MRVLVIYKSKWRIFSSWCNIQHTLGYWECNVGFSPPPSHGERFGHLDHCRLSDGNCQHSSCHFLRGSRTEALKSLLWNIEMEQGQHQHYNIIFPAWNLALVLAALTKPPFELLDQALDQLLTWKTVLLIAFAFCKCQGWNPCFRTCPIITDRRLNTGDSPSRPVIHIKTQVLSKSPKCVLPCTIPALDRHLSMAEDRLLFPIRALRFYLERSMPWREHKRGACALCHSNQGINETLYHPQSLGGSEKTILECYTNPLHLSSSPTSLRHTRYDPWLHRSHSTDRPPWNRFCKLVPGTVITPSPTLSEGPISLFHWSHSTRTGSGCRINSAPNRKSLQVTLSISHHPFT